MFFIFDNRLPNTSTFDMEASIAQFNRLNISFLGKYLSISSIHPWCLRPKYILVAASPDKTKIISGDQLASGDLSKLINVLESRFMQVNVSTLEIYLPNAISNIMNIISKFTNAMEKVHNVVFITNSQSLGTGDHWDNTFIKLKDAFMSYSKIQLHLRIVCVALETTSNFDDRVFRIQRSLQGIAINSTVQFVPIVNSRLHYDAELRNIIAIHAPRVLSILNVPKVNNMRLNLTLLIEPCTIRAADVMHAGLSQLEPHSIISRSGVAPQLIDGFALRVLPHPFTKTGFSSESSYHQNNISFHCLVKMLSAEDTVLILKTSIMSVCDQYWALIPPVIETLQSEQDLCREMTMIRLVDCDSLLPSISLESVVSGGDLRDRLASNSRRTSLRDYEAEDLDATSEYLCAAVIGTLGPHAEYNPFACPSGRLTYLLDSRSVDTPSKNSAAPIPPNVTAATTKAQPTPPTVTTNLKTAAKKQQPVQAKEQPPQQSSTPKTFLPANYQPLASAPMSVSVPVSYPPLTVRVRSGGCSDWDDNSPVGTKPRTNSRLTKVADIRATATGQSTSSRAAAPTARTMPTVGEDKDDAEGDELSSDADSLLDHFFKPDASGKRGRGRKQTTKGKK